MNTATKLSVSVVGVVVIFAAAIGVGSLGSAADAEQVARAGGHAGISGMDESATRGAQELSGGLMVSDRSFSTALEAGTVPTGTATQSRFRILGPGGAVVGIKANSS